MSFNIKKNSTYSYGHNINLRSEPYPFDFVVNDGGGGGGGGGGGRVASSNRASKAMSVEKKVVIYMKYIFLSS